MSDPTPELTYLETVAQLAAEAATAALLPRLEEQAAAIKALQNAPAPVPAVPADVRTQLDMMGTAINELANAAAPEPAAPEPADVPADVRTQLDTMATTIDQHGRRIADLLLVTATHTRKLGK